MGRRAVAKAQPFGTTGVLCFDSEEQENEQESTPKESKDASAPACSPRSERTLREAGDSPQLEMQPGVLPNLHTLSILKDSDTFYAFHSPYMIGRSFARPFQQAIWTVLTSADGAVLQTYNTIFCLWDWESQRVRTLPEVDISKGRDCLVVLQEQHIARHEDAAAVLMVAQLLLVYHLITLCTSASSILRSGLIRAAPFYQELLLRKELDPITVTPVMLDVVDALVRRERPTLRISGDSRYIIDRSVGLCWSLIPLLQELCECSYRAKASSEGFHNGSDDVFTAVERDIRMWEPRPPPDFFRTYTPIEAATMLLQARVYRTAALLIIHRLRYPLGIRDEEAEVQARLICTELSAFLAWAPDGDIGLPVGLPLLVAALEARDAAMEIMPRICSFKSNRQLSMQYERLIDHAWKAREGGYPGSWFDILDCLRTPVIP